MAEENLTLNKVLKKIKNVAGFKDLSPKQMMTKLASSKQSSVMNAVRAAKFTGGLATIAGGLLIEGIAKVVAQDQSSVPQKGPMRLAGRGQSKVDKEAIQKAVEEAREDAAYKEYKEGSEVRASRKRDDEKDYPTVAPKSTMRPKSRPSKLAPKESVRPKARNLNMGGMAKAKPRTGNMDYRMGGMFMKNGNK